MGTLEEHGRRWGIQFTSESIFMQNVFQHLSSLERTQIQIHLRHQSEFLSAEGNAGRALSSAINPDQTEAA